MPFQSSHKPLLGFVIVPIRAICTGNDSKQDREFVPLDKFPDMLNGELVEKGTHKALLKQNGRYAQMYQLQQANRHLQQIEEETKQLEEAV